MEAWLDCLRGAYVRKPENLSSKLTPASLVGLVLPGRYERPAGTTDVSLVAWTLLPLDWLIPRTDSVPVERPEQADRQMLGNLPEAPNRTSRGAVPGGSPVLSQVWNKRLEAIMDERLRLLEKSIATLADELQRVNLRLTSEVEAQALEITALNDFLRASFPDFQDRYPAVRESAVRADPSKEGSEELPSGA